MPEESAQSRASAPAPDFKAVAKIAQRIRLTDVRLSWSQLGMFTEREQIASDWVHRAFLAFDSQALVPDGEERELADHFLVRCIFQLRYFADLDSGSADHAPEPDEDNPPDVAIEAVFDLTYNIGNLAGATDDDLRHFALANGTHNAWPYWREFAQSTSVRLGLDPYVAGPFKLPSRDDPPEEGKESSKTASSP